MYKGADVDPWQLGNASDHFKTQEMCNEAMREDSYAIKFVPDWFVTQQQVKICMMTITIAMIMNLLSGT